MFAQKGEPQLQVAIGVCPVGRLPDGVVIPERQRPFRCHSGPSGEDCEVERAFELAVGIDDIDQQRARIADQQLRRRRDLVVLLRARHYSSAA
ncbi:MAG: hypothetical protein LKM31_13510 [Sphingobium sp.]|jgi:hypothetical protein|nr:hypothetical protein [Sphingobium sp.]